MNREQVHVYTPDSELRRPAVLLQRMINDGGAARGLAWTLARRDIQAQYRGALFGILWAFVTPLMSTAMWLFLSATGIVKLAATDIPYPAYVFTGTMLWQIFVEAVQSPLQQINLSKPLLAKLNIPREAVILAGIIKVSWGALVKLVILLPAILVLGVLPDWHLVLAPFGLIALVLSGIAIGLVVAPIGMLYSDVGRALPIATQLTMYLTPVLFAMPAHGLLAAIYRWNPTTPLILTARAWLTGSATPMLPYFLWVLFAVSILLFIGWVLYRITMPIVIEHLNS